MNDIENKNHQSFILTDTEFAKLMMSEFTAQQNHRSLAFRRAFRTQFTLWAAGLAVFIVYSPRSLTVNEEFSIRRSSYPEPTHSQIGRDKSGGASVMALPGIMAEFFLEENPVSGPHPDTSTIMQTSISSVEIRSHRIRDMRLEIHENGKLVRIRRLDKLNLPIEQSQPAMIGGQIWGYSFEQNADTLVCVKPDDAPRPPVRLTTPEMMQRAELFPTRCLFRARR